MPADSITYDFTGLAQDTTHYVWVDFTNIIGTSPPAAASFDTPQGTPDANPLNMTFSNVGSSSINVRWDNNCTNETTVELWKNTINKPPHTGSVVLAADTTSHNFVSLSPNTTYYFGVIFRNSYGITPELNGSQATTSSFNPTGLVLTTNLDTGPVISGVDAHAGSNGIDIGDVLRIIGPQGKQVEEVLVTDTNMKKDIITIQRALNNTKAVSFPTGSTIDVNHSINWVVAGNTGKDILLDGSLNNKSLQFMVNLDVTQNRPFIEVDNLIKIDNEIMRVVKIEANKKTNLLSLITVKSRGDQGTIVASHNIGSGIYVNHK